MKTSVETSQFLQAEGRLRLHPSICNPNWLVLRRRGEIFRGWIDEMNLRYAVILDIGGSMQPYRELFKCELRYIAIDLRFTPLVNAIADADWLPFVDHTFDAVICTQTLQYVRDPRQVLSEIYRVLKPSGVLLLSIPAIYPIDSEKDRWRFLPAGIKELTAQYSSVQIVPEDSNVAAFFRSINTFMNLLATYRPLQSLLSHTIVPVFNLLGLGLERLLRMNNSALSTNYSVRAQR